MESIHRSIDYPKISLLLEQKYFDYNHPEFIAPDPLAVVREYTDITNREFTAFIASQFALGRACCISDTARAILATIIKAAEGKTKASFAAQPQEALLTLSEIDLQSAFTGFVYRFFTSNDVVGLLLSLQHVYRSFKSLEALLACALEQTRRDLPSALALFVQTLVDANPQTKPWKPNLVASPANGSACKRLMLFLRWMVRKDAVDPGGWSVLSPAELLAPLDTHAIRSYRQLGFIETSAVTMKTVLAVTEHLRRIAPDDPLKYDFVLSRPYASCE